MGYYWNTYQKTICEFLNWSFSSKKEKKIIWPVPKYCRNCNIIGICRDANNNWKCKNGCRFMK